MSSFSVGDEVRFRTSPDVIGDGQQPVKPRTKQNGRPSGQGPGQGPGAGSVRDRRHRLQATVNAHGMIELSLAGKGLRDVPREVFSLLRLEALRLGNNRIHSLSSAVSHLHKLKVLDVHRNELQTLPETLTNCIHLQELYLSHNKLSSLPSSLGHLSSLRVLTLAHNNFESLPHELGDLEALQSLDVSGNKLWHLPYSVQDLRYLRALNLSDNLYEQLPITVCYLSSLEALNLRRNRLVNLPPDFDALKGLQELSLAGNRLETVPYVLPHLRHLHSLDLSHNKLRSVPPRLAKLTRLRVLLVQGNKISSLPNNIEALEHLNASDNALHNFSVAHMKRLVYLNANNNQLENMPLGVYNLRHLEELHLSGNRLSYLSQDVVLLRRLRLMDLGNNQLTSLPHGIAELERLETFNVRGNRIEGRHPFPQGHLAAEGGDQGSPREERGHSPPRASQHSGQHSTHHSSQANIRGGNPHYMTGSRDNPDSHSHHNSNHHSSNHQNSNHHHSNHHNSDHQDTRGHQPQEQDNPGTVRRQGNYYRKKQSGPAKHKSKWIDKFTLKRKVRSSRYPPHHRNTGTQYTPKGSVKSRERPPLDYKPSANSLASLLSLPRSKHSHAQTNGHIPNGSLGAKVNGTSLTPTAVMNSNPLSVSEISYPMGSAPLHPQPSTSTGGQTPGGLGAIGSVSNTGELTELPNGPIQAWTADPPGPPSIHSDTVTVNSTVGDNLSLGDEDFEYQPTTVADDRLKGVCDEVESMLNKQLLQPFTQTRGIFRKGMNEDGTLRTLNSIARGKVNSLQRYSPGETAIKVASSDGVVHLSREALAKSKPRATPLDKLAPGGLKRLKRDAFKVTPAGGHFRSTTDPKVSIYYPVNAVDSRLTFTMQLEEVDPYAVEQAKLQEPHTDNLLAVGDILHFKFSRRTDFLQQVTVTIQLPLTRAKGELHLVVYREDNTCTPSSSDYSIHQGYITLHAWHLSGIGAVITKSKSKYKACRSMEHLLKYLYV